MRKLAAAIIVGLVAGPLAAQATATAPVLVFFDWGKPEINGDAAAILDTVVARYRESGGAALALSGHTDRSGGAASNRRSARLRAEAVRTYLGSHGIPVEAMAVRSFGEERPLIATEDGVREPQNRRVEISFGAAAPR